MASAATSGVIVSRSGAPIADATVTVRRAQAVTDRRASVLADSSVTIATTTTSENGTFTFDAKLDGIYALDVASDGFAPATTPILAGSTDLSFMLDAAPPRKGRVTASGKPVANARVIVSQEDAVRYATKTDERGTYTIPSPGRWCNELVIVHPDFAPHAIELTPRTSLDAEVTKGLEINGKVVDAAEKPVANSRVVANWAMTTTSKDGAFTLRVESAPDWIEAFAGDASGSAKKGTTTIAIASRPTISGAVRDATKRPLAGAIVHAFAQNGPRSFESRFAITDDRGNYRVEHLSKPSYMVVAYSSDDVTFEQRANVAAGTKNADFLAHATDSIHGIVVDEQKKPVAGAVVQFVFAGMPLIYGVTADQRGSTISGADGRFQWRARQAVLDVAAEASLQIQATRHGYGAATAAVDTKKAITLTLPKGIDVAGIVVDGEGNPVAGAGIAATLSMMNEALPLDSAMTMGTLEPYVETDADGKFTITLNRGEHDIGVWKSGAGVARIGNIAVAETMEPLRIVLAKGVEIRGRVMIGTQPATSGSIVAQGQDMSFAAATVNSDGTFVLESLTRGPYQLHFTTDDDEASETVTAPADDFVWTVREKGSVHGRVIDADTRQMLREYDVNVIDGRFESTSVDDGSEFTLPLQPGDATLTISADGYQTATQHVSVVTGKTTEVSIALTRGRKVTGRVTADDGSPLTNIVVASDETPGEVEDDGTYEITLPPAAQQLEVRAQGVIAKKLDVPASTSDSRIDIVLARGRSVHGRVLSSEGNGIRAMVSAFDGSDYQTAWTESDGTFTIGGLANGKYEFVAMHPELGSSERISADVATSQEIVLRMPASKGRGTVTGIVRGYEGSDWLIVMVHSGSKSIAAGRDGRYRLENVPAGEIEVRAMAQSSDGNTLLTEPMKVMLADGGEVEANFELRAEASVRGTVYDHDQPAPGRAIRFSSNESMFGTTSGANGEYTIKALPRGTYNVTVSTTGDREFATTRTITGSDRFDIRMEWSRVEGRVVDAQGAAIAGAQIVFTSDKDSSRAVEAKSDSNGAFVATLAGSGGLFVRAEKEGFTTFAKQIPSDSGPIVITLERSEGLHVRLVDARTGQTLGGYAVAVNGAGILVARASDGTDRTLTVPVGAGTYRIAVSATNYASQSTRVVVPHEGEVRFALTPGGTLIVNSERAVGERVKLILPGGEEYVQCQCNGIAEIRLTGKVTTIDHVAPGSYTMQVLDENHAIKAVYPVTVAEGQTSTVQF